MKKCEKVKELFKAERARQRKIANGGGGMLTRFPSGRTELTFGASAFGCHALSAMQSARFLASRV